MAERLVMALTRIQETVIMEDVQGKFLNVSNLVAVDQEKPGSIVSWVTGLNGHLVLSLAEEDYNEVKEKL